MPLPSQPTTPFALPCCRNIFPDACARRGQALYTVVGYGLPGVIGGLGGGLLSADMGLGSVFWLSSAVAALALACSLRLRHLQGRAVETG